MTEMVRLEGVSKRYGDVTALSPTDLVVHEGEFMTLLGPSGSGKTTILNLIAGTVPPTDGRVWIHGRDVTRVPSSQRRLGMVFQNYALFPHMTIRENIAFPLKVRRTPSRDISREVARVLELVRLPDVADRKPKELSGGQQQRIAIARCLVYNPDLILMDEPLGALDKKLREQMQLEMKRLHESLSMTILYVTHDQDEALVMSDRVCLMNEGRIEQLARPQDLYFRPNTIFSADFLGESNIIEADVVDCDGLPGLSIADRIVVRDVAIRGGCFGSRVRVMVRPESVRVLDNGDVAEHMIDGTVDEVIFVGGITNVRVLIGDGLFMTAKSLTRRQQVNLTKGQRVRLALDAADIVQVGEASTGTPQQ